ncbi:MAG: hypothetical protein JWL85_841 [Candidatus Saccharibacteria bacterium]|nr:hypothetical protein [Candidatus Saccharibacteria bacterium]
MSVYFEYLSTGQHVSVNGSNTYLAASLIKLPLIMQLYKDEELGKIDTGKIVEVRPEALNKSYGDLWKKGAGHKLTLDETAELTIVKSDNTAAQTVVLNIEDVYTKIDILLEQLHIKDEVIPMGGPVKTNAKAYATFMRCLYESCYLSKEHSQKILGYMTRTEVSALRKGVPSGVTVADKFGVFQVKEGGITFDDCGIIYSPKGDYTLCIMGSGMNRDVRREETEISKIVYGNVQNQW